MQILKSIFSKDRKLLFDIVIALIVGIVFGNFLGDSIIKDETLGVVADGYNSEIYLIQSGIYYDVLSANQAYNEMKQLGIESLVVQEHNKYYLYHGVAADESEFDALIKVFDDHQIDYFIKTKNLFTSLNQLGLDQSSEEYQFYYQSIDYYMRLVNGQRVTLEDQYMNQVDDNNLGLFNNIQALNNTLYTSLTPKYELHAYKNLANILM